MTLDNYQLALSLLDSQPSALAVYRAALESGASDDEIAVGLDVLSERGPESAQEFFGVDAKEVADRSTELEPTDFADLGDDDTDTSARYSDLNSAQVKNSAGQCGRYTVPVYRVDDACGGDYFGGLYNRSNYRVIERMTEECDFLAEFVVFLYGGYGSFGIAFRLDRGLLPQELFDVIAALESYPILDEQDWSELEQEDQQEQWECWGRSDFVRELESQATEAQQAIIGDWSNEESDGRFWEACEAIGRYPECSGQDCIFPLVDAAKHVIENWS